MIKKHQLIRMSQEYAIREHIKVDPDDGKRYLWVFVQQVIGTNEMAPLGYIVGGNCLKFCLDKDNIHDIRGLT